MKNRRVLPSLCVLCAVIATLLLPSCGGDEISVVGRNFKDEIQRYQNLQFTFDTPLIADSLTGRWDTVSFLEFSPKVAGKFRWNSPVDLEFSPSDGFKPSTDYKVALTEALLRNANGKSLSSDKEFAMHTPYLKLEAANSFWAKASDGGVELRVQLHFTEIVDAADVAKLFSVSIGGASAKFTVAPQPSGRQITIAVADAEGQPAGYPAISLRVDKGLRCIESGSLTVEAQELSFTMPNRDRIQIISVAGGFDGIEPIIAVSTSQAVENKDIQSLISISPDVAGISVELQEQGFAVKGNFLVEKTYQIIISGRLIGVVGGEMREDYSQYVQFGDMQPTIEFTEKRAMYLSSKGEKSVGLRIVNVPKIKVQIIKIYENNILSLIRNGSGWYDEETNEDYSSYDWIEADYYGDVIEDKIIETKNLPRVQNYRVLKLNFTDKTMFKGIYLVKVKSDDEEYLSATKPVAISDIGLIAKETENEIVVFANSLIDASPISGVTAQLVSSNNQQVYKATTGSDGTAVFSDIKAKAPGFKIRMITARKDNEYTFLHFNKTRVENSRFDVGGRYDNAAGYQAFLYGGRNIYRPGETIHISGILRDDLWQTAANIPVKLKLLLPNGGEFRATRHTLDEQGAFEAAIDLPTAMVTGTYTAELYSANDVLLTSQYISVEEFIPDRISVNFIADKEIYATGETVKASLRAANLFGPPAAHRNYQMEFSLVRKQFISKNFSDYDFTVVTPSNPEFDKTMREGKTDENGEANETFDIPKEYTDMGLLSGRIFTTVFDETGRPVNRAKQFDVITQPVFFGIKRFDSYVSARRPFDIRLAAATPDGKGHSGAPAMVQIVKLTWQNVIEREGSSTYYRTVSQKQEQILSVRTMNVGGNGTVYTFTPQVSGEYEIRVFRPGNMQYVSRKFYAYGWGMTERSSFSVNKEGQIDIELDKPQYNIGEKANVLFKTPFSGKLLVTVERNRVVERFMLQTDKLSATLTLPVKEDYLPNVYIAATLFRPVDDGAMPLTVATGFAPVYVIKPSAKLPVSINVSEKSRSNTKQTVTVRTGEPNSQVTIAVVDEGILQLKDFKTPDPHGFFYAKRALEVRSYNVYPLLFPEIIRRRSSVGGDGYDLNKRINPFASKRTNLIALWSGVLRTGSNGTATFSFDIPQFSGALRVMAVAYKNKSFGSSEKRITVADPITVSSALPRFCSPHDTLIIPVTLTNTTNKQGQVTASISASGSISTIGAGKQSASIKPNGEVQLVFRAVAGYSPGISEIVVSAVAFGETFTEKTEISARPAAGLLKTSGNGVVQPGQTASITVVAPYIPSSISAKLVIGRSPLVQFADNLRDLTEYPYGCVEQTISTAFPQIYYADLTKALMDGGSVKSNPAYNVQQAVRKAEAMQLYNGAVSYWQGGEAETWWGTAYAAHFLREAQQAGYDVNPEIHKRMLGYLAQKVKERATEKYRYYDASMRLQIRETAPKEAAYSLYVLALCGREDIPSMNYYKSSSNLLALDSKYLIACAYRLTGDVKTYRALLPGSFLGELCESVSGGSFASPERDMGIVLNTLLDVEPDNGQIAMLARHLSEQIRRRGKFFSTQENVFALLGLGKIARKNASTNAKAVVFVNGKTLGTADEKALVLSNGIAGQKVNIAASGGAVYYFWETEGLSKDGSFKQEDSYLKVRRTYLDRKGAVITDNSFRQNDLVVVKLTISTTDRSTVDNVVITDLLPAGFEIENPRIGAVAELSWIKDATVPQHFDIRDDRMNIFAVAGGEEKHFYYLARAVSKGIFTLGPVTADAMYRGEFHSANGSGRIRVE
ncbi:hypothetical protein MASR2M18_20070 [Ignavibacteria bacterium]|nr:alpha-2-macroglobulin family protein [Bacteroidota bacterium]MCZ2132601.1 alpha-2-macroglobulin family protein [Bacteroidota bacterium]